MNRLPLLLSAILGASPPAVIDADVQAYASRVSAAGGVVPTDQQSALSAFVTTLKTAGIWSALREVWIPLGASGDIAAAAVKLLNGATNASVGFVGLTSANYTTGMGIDPGVAQTGKRVTTDFVPSVNGSLSASNWGVSVYLTREISVNDGCVMGVQSGSQFYMMTTLGAAGTSRIGTSGVSLQPLNTSEKYRAKRMLTSQINAGTAQHYYGGWLKNSASQASPVLPTVGLQMLATGGAGYYGDPAVAGYMIHTPLTPAQLRALQSAWETLNTAIGRSVFSEAVNGICDSYGAPTPVGPSSAANAWVSLLGASTGWGSRLLGVPGRGWYNTDVNKSMGNYQGNSAVIDMLANPSKRNIVAMGINDVFYAAPIATSEANYRAWLTKVQDSGLPMANVRLATNYWSQYIADQTLSANVAAMIRTVAADFGLQVIDFHAGRANGRTDIAAANGDIHYNDLGHTLLFQDAQAATVGWNV